MEKIIKLGNYEIPVKSTAASLISYKANFGRDGLKDLLAFAPAVAKISDDGDDKIQAIIQSGLDLDVFYRFLWVFAKAKTPDIPPLEQWLDGFDVSPFDFLTAALPEVAELLTGTVAPTVTAKN